MNIANKQKKHLRGLLTLFFFTLAIPIIFLLRTVYSQLENEAYFTNRQHAETLVDQIEQNINQLLEAEQSRPIAEYQFFNVMANPLLSETSAIKFSPLSEIPPKTKIKGIIGYFQINTDGSFHLPVLPEIGQDNLSGLSLAELESRLLLKKKMRALLSIKKAEKKPIKKALVNEPLKKKVEAIASNQPYIEAFKQQAIYLSDEIASPVDKLKSETYTSKRLFKKARSSKALAKRQQLKPAKKYNTRKETVKLPDQTMASNYFKQQSAATLFEQEDHASSIEKDAHPIAKPSSSIINILSFESEVTPLQLLFIDPNYFCFYRYIWHDGNRYTQGFIVKNDVFLQAISAPLTNASGFSSVTFSNNNELFKKINITSNDQEYELYKRYLTRPFQKMEISINTAKLSKVPGSLLIDLLSLGLFAILLVGFFVFYRLGSKQIDLTTQQQNFISAVSHELKTPLTSIRMYAEMLRSGWVADHAKKQTYYDFIFFESERLSRLIANVLQFSRIEHQQQAKMIDTSAQQLLSRIESKIEAQIEASCFKLSILHPLKINHPINIKIDDDAFFQIVINLIDNAIKFSGKAELKQIDLGFKISKNHQYVIFFIRDYGSGIKKNQLKKIFTLFYRTEDELTRTTAGTGIGLALVAQLAESMNAKITVTNKHPGAEFQIKVLIV